MNEIVLKQNKLTSLQLAEITGKTHSHILRDIRNMEKAWYFITGTKFGFSDPTGGWLSLPKPSL